MLRLDPIKKQDFQQAVGSLLSSPPSIRYETIGETDIKIASVVDLIVSMENAAAASVWLDKLSSVTSSTLEEFKKDLSATEKLLSTYNKHISDEQRFQMYILAEWLSQLNDADQSNPQDAEKKETSTLAIVRSRINETNALLFKFSEITNEEVWKQRKKEIDVYTKEYVRKGLQWYERMEKLKDIAKLRRENKVKLEQGSITKDEFRQARDVIGEEEKQYLFPLQDRTLIYDSRKGDIAQVKALLDDGADPNVQDDGGSTPLSVASYEGHINIINALLEKGAYPEKKDIYGYTPLIRAIYNNRIDIVNLLLGKGVDPDTKNEYGYSPLGMAVEKGRIDIILALLKKKANPNIKGKEGDLLYLAACNGRIDIFKLLLKYGANPNIKDESQGIFSRGTLLSWAAANNRVDVINALKKYTNPNSDEHVHVGNFDQIPLLSAAYSRRLAVVNALLENGSNPNARDKFSKTALFWAVYQGHTDVVEAFLEKGADPDIKCGTYYPMAALYNAQEKRFSEIVNILTPLTETPDKAKNHIRYLLSKGYTLADLPYTLKEPYPELLKTIVVSAAEQGRADILSAVFKNYKNVKLNCLNDKDVIQKINVCLENDSLISSFDKLAIIRKLKLLNFGNVEKTWKVEEAIRFFRWKNNDPYHRLFKAVGEDNFSEMENILKKHPDLNLNEYGNLDDQGMIRCFTLLDIAYMKKIAYDIAETKDEGGMKDKINETTTSDTVKMRQDENKKIFFKLFEKSNINARTLNEQTLLHTAVTAKAPISDITLFLLKGANPNFRDKEDKRPLDYLLDENGNLKDEEMRDYKGILEKGIDYLFQPDANALLASVMNTFCLDPASISYYHLLMEYPYKQDTNGNTILHRAVKNKDIAFIKSLHVKNDVDMNIQNNEGMTALHVAVRYGDIDTLNLLLEQGADPNTQDKQGNTPLHYATMNKNSDMIQVLLKKGTDCHIKNKDGQESWRGKYVSFWSKDKKGAAHLEYLVNFSSLEKVLEIKKPYPELLKAMVDRAVQEGRIDILNKISNNYTNEQLSFLKNKDFIEKIGLRLDKLKLTLPKMYSNLR